MKQMKRILAVLLAIVLLCGAAPAAGLMPVYAATGREKLDAAIAKLPDAVNLYYYTDQAILWVADALGGGYTDADAFIADASENGYQYVGSQAETALLAAAERIEHLAVRASDDPTTLNGKIGTIKLNRDESKATASITVVPAAVNGEPCTVANRTVQGIQAGDQITFDVYGHTDYYVSGALFPIFFDKTKFAVVSARGRVQEWNNVTLNGLLNTDKTSEDLIDNYDIECNAVDGKDLWYGPEATDAFKADYKYLLCEVSTLAGADSKALKFEGDNSYLFSFTLSVKNFGAFDGTVSTEIGTDESAYTARDTNGDTRWQGITINRAAGYLADGVTPATHGANDYSLPYAWSPWDTAAYGGQYYKAENATVIFGTSEAHVHVYNDGVVTTEPTCTTAGVKTFTCTDPACDKSEGWQITEPVAALGHDFSGEWSETTPATCTEAGEATRGCSRCDATETQPIAALGHDFSGEWSETAAPTCTEAGEEMRGCSRCDATETRSVKALGHNYSEWTMETEPTCTKKGMETRECARCQDVAARPVDALGHDYQLAETTATCTEGGVTKMVCSRCGDNYTTGESPALGHDFGEWHVTTAATCTEAGEETRECSRCDATETQPVAALGHDFDSVVTEPTCTAKGYTTFSCKRCTYSYTINETQELGHDFGAWAVTTPATCTAAGEETRECSRCDATETQPIASLGHSYDAVVTAPTCTAKGYTTHTCARCGDSYTTDEKASLGHDFGAWAVTTPATCTTAGEETRACSRCDATETKPVAALGHDYTAAVTAPTCTAKGYTTYTCSVCGDSYTAEYTDKIPHAYSSVVTPPACETEGYTTYTCSVCGDSYVSDRVPALGHDWGEWTVVTAPTPTKAGLERRVCKNDPSHVEERAIAPISSLVLKDSSGKTGNPLDLTIPYTRRRAVATTLTATNPDLTLTFSSSNTKILYVDASGEVHFTRMRPCRKTATITVEDQYGRTAQCNITVKYRWYHYILWVLFGCLWF